MEKTIDYLVDTGFKDISFVNIGQQICSPRHSYGPLSQDKHLIHIVLSGKGKVNIDGRKYNLGKGNYFYFNPGEVTYYEADHEDPWHYFWFGFKASENFHHLQDTIEEIGTICDLEFFEKSADELTKIDYSLVENSIMIQSKLLGLLATFLDNAQTHHCKKISAPSTAFGQTYSDKFCRKVRTSYWKQSITIEEIAEDIGLNPAYFSTVIKEELNKTPLEYLVDYRLEKGERHIMYTNQSISEISYLVGYKNTNNFSRAFKQKYGKSPSSYRKKVQKELRNKEEFDD